MWLAKTFIGTHWIKKCETCPFRANPTILAGPTGLTFQGYYLDWASKQKTKKF